ncbi:MAG: transglycosylase domain-containing protein [Chitinophagales bacterium]
MKLKRITKRVLIFLIFFGFLLVSGVVIILETGGKKYLQTDTKKELVASIKQSKELPENFLQAYCKLYPGSLKSNYWGYVTEHLINKNSDRRCPCRKVALFTSSENINYSRGFYKLAPTMIGLELEDYVSQEQCLNYISSKYNFLRDVNGVWDASWAYFNKDLQDLNNEELAGLLSIIENPVLYDMKRHPDLFDKKRKEIIKKIVHSTK